MKKIIINSDYNDPNNCNIEVVERKGLGHPDSLADMLAKECSRAYSKFCIDNFGCVLHHNFDKLYIGAGCFRYENNCMKMYDKVKVFLNGRASNTMNGKTIDLEKLLKPVIKKYIHSILPRLDVDNELDIHINCTQNTKMSNWFSPENISDIPDAKELFANDTSLCISHFPNTICENITLEAERFFWNFDGEYPSPKYSNVGQDIKVMTSRINNNIDVTICLPVYSDVFKNFEEYKEIVKDYEQKLTTFLLTKVPKEFNINIAINRLADGNYRNYSLIKGSCIECGEEGVVGRGNDSRGLISALRSHTMEAPFGKNERYHTGRVLSYVSDLTTKRIYQECNIKSSLYCLTRNRNKLMEPFMLYLSVNKSISKEEERIIEKIIEEEFNEKTYLLKILNDKSIY